MEDPRLSRMYARLLAGSLVKRRARLWQWMRENRSSLLSLLAAGALAVFVTGYVAHLHGRFRRLKTELKTIGTPQVNLPPMPGGQEAVILQRTTLGEGTTPEFISATLLPGRGLNVLQIMVSIPGRGTVPLLQAPSLEDAATLMSGVQADVDGVESLRLGSPIEAPWAGVLSGAKSDVPGALVTTWRGRTLVLPMNGANGETPMSQGGLLMKAASDSVKHNIMPDGGTVQGTFAAGVFGNRWPSQTSVSATALLSSHIFELKLVARNEGGEPVPFGLGWRPQILFPGGSRAGVRLRLPADEYEETSAGRATGRLPTVAGTALDFTDRTGKLMRNLDLDETFVDLHSGFLDNGPMVEIRDERSGVGIRMTAMSPQIHAIHVRSLAKENEMVLGFQTNFDDPFSHAWVPDDGTSINVLQPGQTLQWRVRMELFAIPNSSLPTL